jgi:hypothetical protein
MYRPKRVRHIRYEPSHLLFDARHVFNAINAAKQRGAIKQSPEFNKLEYELGQISLHLATRANILRTAVNIMNHHMEVLIEVVRSSTDPPENSINAPDSDVYGLLLYMDSFFFEAKAFEEALRNFYMKVFKQLLKYSPKKAKETFQQIAAQCGQVSNEPWREFLYRVRRLFIHTAAPWVVVDVSRSDEGVFDFLVISENIKDFAQAPANSFFPSIRDMNQLWTCLQTMAQAIEDILIDRISQLKPSEAI